MLSGSVRHTVVGDQLLRGVSGGERKRVTIAEALMGRPQLLLLDDITVCLHSAPACIHSLMLLLSLLSRLSYVANLATLQRVRTSCA